jgi:hypothetical protein
MAIVEIEAASPHGGWTGRNIFANRQVRIKSAVRLLGDVTARGKRVERDMIVCCGGRRFRLDRSGHSDTMTA